MNDLKYQLKRSTRAKRLSLNISSSEGLEVIAPLNTSKSVIERFLIEKQSWIKKHQHLIDAAKKPFVLPCSINLLALEKRWEIVYMDSSQQKLSLKVFPERILLSKNNLSKKNFQKVMKCFLKKIAIQHLSLHLNQLSKIHKLPFEQLTFRMQKTRWGSCSPEKNITLNVALLFMPLKTVHYVMLHELCHTQHLNHSKQFWQKVESLIPNYDQHRKILKQTDLYLPTWI